MVCKSIRLFFVLSVILLFFPQLAVADGCGYVIGKLDDPMLPLAETSQTCSIDYKDGMEEMLLSIDVDLEGENAVWLFPIPAKPEEAGIDIVKGFPAYTGQNIKAPIVRAVKEDSTPMYLSQVWPLSFWLWGLGVYKLGGMSTDVLSGFEGVDVYEHVERMGVSSELVTAKDASALGSYLTGKGMKLEGDSLSVFGDYLGKDYSFVVTWISDVEKYESEGAGDAVSVKVGFPASSIYYPLKPTSFYGDKNIPAIIYVNGYVSPKVYGDISEYSKIDYYSTRSGQRYTKIVIDAPSNRYKEDLWMSTDAPLHVLLLDLAASNASVMVLILFILYSCLASVLAGRLVYRNNIGIKRLALLGLANLFTLIGFALAVYRFLEPVNEYKEKGSSRRTLKWVGVGSAVVLFALIALFILSPDSWTAIVIFILVVIFTLIGPLALLYMASRGQQGKFIALFSLSFLGIAFLSNTLIAGMYSENNVVQVSEGGGFKKFQPLMQTIIYNHSGTFSISLMNVVGTSIKVTSVGVYDLTTNERCKVEPLNPSIIGSGDDLSIKASCPEKRGGDQFEVGIGVKYTAVVGTLSSSHSESGGILGTVE